MSGPELVERFSRQMLLRGVGPEGVRRLRASRVLVVGCGALGSAQAELMARAGAGFLRVVDRDVVSLSNIHRTHMVGELEARAGTPKALACAAGIREIDSSIAVEPIIDDVDSDNVIELVKDVDIVLDGTDNLETRMLINEAAVKLGKPWIYAGVNSWYGSVMLIEPGKGPCLRCLFTEWREAAGSCDVVPTIGTVTTLVASVAAGLAVRYLVGDRPRPGELLVIDGRNMSIERVSVERNPQCPVCSLGHFELLGRRPSEGLTRVCGSESFKARLREPLRLSPQEIAARLSRLTSSVITAEGGWVRALISGVAVTVMPPRLIVIEGASEDQANEVYKEVLKSLSIG